MTILGVSKGSYLQLYGQNMLKLMQVNSFYTNERFEGYKDSFFSVSIQVTFVICLCHY